MGNLQSNGWILTLVRGLCILNLPLSLQQNPEWLSQFSKLRCLFLHWWMIVYNWWAHQNWRLAIFQFDCSRTTPLVFYLVVIFVWSPWSVWSVLSLDGFSILFQNQTFIFHHPTLNALLVYKYWKQHNDTIRKQLKILAAVSAKAGRYIYSRAGCPPPPATGALLQGSSSTW